MVGKSSSKSEVPFPWMGKRGCVLGFLGTRSKCFRDMSILINWENNIQLFCLFLWRTSSIIIKLIAIPCGELLRYVDFIYLRFISTLTINRRFWSSNKNLTRLVKRFARLLIYWVCWFFALLLYTIIPLNIKRNCRKKTYWR